MFNSNLLDIKILEGFNCTNILDGSIEIVDESFKFHFIDYTVCINKEDIKGVELIPLTEYLSGITTGNFSGVSYINDLIKYGNNISDNLLVFRLDDDIIVFECKKYNAIIKKFNSEEVHKSIPQNIFYNTPTKDNANIKDSILSFGGEYLGGSYVEGESFLHYVYLLDEELSVYKQQQINFPSLFKIDLNIKYSDIKQVSIENYESILNEYYIPRNGYFHYANLVFRSKSKGYYDEIKNRKILKVTYSIDNIEKIYLIEVKKNIDVVYKTINSKI